MLLKKKQNFELWKLANTDKNVQLKASNQLKQLFSSWE